MSDYTHKVLLSLTPETVATLDTAAKVLGMCRSDVIRRSLARDLSYVLSHEFPNCSASNLKHAQHTATGLAANAIT
jgi:hypothetical protein